MTQAAKVFTANEIATLVRVQFRPKLVLLEIIQVLTRKKIAIPSYNVLATLIVAGVGHHQHTLSQIVNDCLSESQRGRLDELLEKEPGATTADEGWRYRLTLLKKPYQSTRPSKIKANLADLDTLQARYLELKPVVERLGLSYEGIRHYAYAVIKAQITQVSRRADEARYLHLIAFVVYQTFKLNDTLIDTLLSAVQAAVNAADKAHKEAYYQERGQRTQSFAALADRLGQSVRETLSAIKRIVADHQLSDSEKVAAIDAALAAQDGKPNPVERQIDEFKQNLATIHLGRDYSCAAGGAIVETATPRGGHRAPGAVRSELQQADAVESLVALPRQGRNPSTRVRRSRFCPQRSAPR